MESGASKRLALPVLGHLPAACYRPCRPSHALLGG